MSLVTIRDQVKSVLSTPVSVVIVHDYIRWTDSWAVFQDLFKTSDSKINGWMITRTATPEKWLTNIEYLRVYEFMIRGAYALKDGDASEIVFQDIIEDICDEFRGNNTLNGTCETIAPEFGSLAGRSGIQVETVEHRLFGKVLCHYCELRLGAQVTEHRA